jgi:hypothetical protein
MAIKKSDLYSSLWASCDELRGGMDASQYKDYVLFMLFIKYVSDKYGESDDFAPPVTIPKGASFKDMIALKGKPDIGDKINTQIIQPLIHANSRLARTDFPDFNDPNKLGEGQAMVDRLTNLDHRGVRGLRRPVARNLVRRKRARAFLIPAGHFLARRFAHRIPAKGRELGIITARVVFDGSIAELACALAQARFPKPDAPTRASSAFTPR